MNIKTLKEAFEIINIDMLYDEGIIREKKAGNEDYYGFQFSEKLWNIFSYQRGNKKILYSFDEKSKAVKHFMIFMIKKKILKEYYLRTCRCRSLCLAPVSVCSVMSSKCCPEASISAHRLSDI